MFVYFFSESHKKEASFFFFLFFPFSLWLTYCLTSYVLLLIPTLTFLVKKSSTINYLRVSLYGFSSKCQVFFVTKGKKLNKLFPNEYRVYLLLDSSHLGPQPKNVKNRQKERRPWMKGFTKFHTSLKAQNYYYYYYYV